MEDLGNMKLNGEPLYPFKYKDLNIISMPPPSGGIT
jgi:gamma-glutamyltranspeptidase